ncbi:MAG: 5'-nucleotidase, lipoprotein e(P4) family [Bryobacteraceae bacterium]
MRPTFLLIPVLAACAWAQPVLDGLNATAWVQTSVEYRACALQAWRSARLSLDRALRDKRWTAALEQTGDPRRLPPAIIVDIDETVLDNSPAQARFLLQGNGRYSQQQWEQWTAEKRALPVPGAREFLQTAAARGVTVFYVTNRGSQEEQATRENLVEQGFPFRDSVAGGLGDALLLRGERPEWTSDKSLRRAAVAAHYRVLLLCGDDLNDFFPARLSPQERMEKARPHDSWWGERWIILPNPMYGSWEDSLYGFDRTLSPADIQQRKLKALRTR